MADDKGVGEGEKKDTGTTTTEIATTKKKKGIISRIWNVIFRIHGDDFEKRLQYISKEEAAVLARMKRRSQSWRRMIRHLIIFSVIFEVPFSFLHKVLWKFVSIAYYIELSWIFTFTERIGVLLAQFLTVFA